MPSRASSTKTRIETRRLPGIGRRVQKASRASSTKTRIETHIEEVGSIGIQRIKSKFHENKD